MPPVATASRPIDWWGAVRACASGRPIAEQRLRGALERTFGQAVVSLTDSGTSALRIAIASSAPATIVAIPGFGCIDVAAAVQGAGCRAIPYDLDPASLAPNLESVEEALQRGARVVVASHLFGLAIPMTDLAALCARYEAVLIEDAAQAFGANIDGAPIGQSGALTVLSFGRGKGIGGGGGGALLARSPALGGADRGSEHAPVEWRSEVRTLGVSMLASWLGAPAVYAIPSAVPQLRLGEMVYHRAEDPRPISIAAASFAEAGLERLGLGLPERARRAARLQKAASRGSVCEPIEPLTGTTPGWLRAPMIWNGTGALPSALGVYRAYPQAVSEQREIRECLLQATGELTGSHRLANRLVTLPVHHRVAERDLQALEQWLAD